MEFLSRNAKLACTLALLQRQIRTSTASRHRKWSKTPFTKCNAMNRDQLFIVRSYLGQAAAVVTAALAVWAIAYLFGSNAYWSLFLLAVWVGLCARVFGLIAQQRASLMQRRRR